MPTILVEYLKITTRMCADCISTMPISLCILTLIIFTFLCHAQSQTSPDRSILLDLKNHFSNSPNISHHWTSSSDHCTWLGITCRNGVVTEIQLGGLIINETIPPFICNLKNLTHLDINNNNIPGSFPTFLYNCSNLEYLDLSFNNISGIIPDDISLLFPRLEALNLTSNWFVGGVPAGIEGLKALKELQLADLFTNGSFPPEIGNLLNLEVLVLSQNSFSPQEIPPSFTQLKKLRHLWMKEANLIGKIPGNISSLEALEFMDLSKNDLSGNIPSDLFLLKNLTTVFLFTNRLSGPIPRPVMALNLNAIDFSNNSLTGSIPEDFGKLTKLEDLALFMNQLSGEIPVGIGRLPALSSIELFMNNLSGELPPDFGRFSKLQVFDVSTNHLTGSLPDGLCENKVLGIMVAFDNNLTGELPKSLEDCNTLSGVWLERNNLSGTIPDGVWTTGPLTRLLINNNQFTGKLPQKVASNLSLVDISNNQFSGEIPPEIGRLKPSSLILSSNHLSGKIPDQFEDAAFEKSFLNNPGLCDTTPSLGLRDCGAKTEKSNKISAGVTAILAAFLFVVACLFMVYVFICYNKRERALSAHDWKLTPFHTLSFNQSNIIPNLREENVVGSGGSGKVAVKRIWSKHKLDEMLEKEFQAEDKILGTIRHSNIVKLWCCISSEESNLLVYEFMENRSLDLWLHAKKRSPAQFLNWPTRLKIAIRTAQGLSYMHHNRSILLHLKNHFSNSPNISHHWTSSSDHCTWLGITCQNGVITKIQLGRLIINDTIPPFICHLKNLTHLDLNNNNIPGLFPTFLYNCSNLQYLDLSFNNLSGIIPHDISLLFPRLEVLNLTSNWFVGGVPAGIEGLKALKELQLAGLFTKNFNLLSGNISSHLFLLKNLTTVFLYINRLSGPIPHPVMALNLNVIDFSNNSLTGSIPEDFRKLTKLEGLSLFMNQLSGKIPVGIGRLPSSIELFMNNLSVEDCNTMSGVRIERNNLSGTIPDGLWTVGPLTELLINNNRFTGQLPQKVASDLSQVDISNNQFSSEIPSGISSWSKLDTFRASNNLLTGKIPQELTALSRTEPTVLEADEIPRTEETEIPVREDLLTELTRVTTWQKWRMSDLDTLEEGLPRMRLEESFALSWLGTSSIPLATTVDQIHRVYSEKLAKREAAKGKAKVVEDEAEAPPTTRPDKVFTKEMRMAQGFSLFKAEFIDPNPQAGPSTRVLEQPNNSAREVGDDTSWTSVAEAETLVTQPNQQAEEATQLSAKESTQEVKATEPSMPTLSPAREVEVPSSDAVFIVDFPSSSQTTPEVEEPSGEQAGGVEVPSPAALQTREVEEPSVEVEPTTTRTENLISVSIGQDRTPSSSPWLIDRLNELKESLKTMDEEQKNMFKMVKQSVEKSHKTVAETKSLVYREAHETKRLVQSHRDQFETSIAADQEFKSSVAESLIYFEMMTAQTQKMLDNVLCGLKQVFDEQANQQAIKGDTQELKEDVKIIHRILGELHSKLQPSPLGHDGDDAKRGEERSQERTTNILGFPTPTSSRGRDCSERRSRTTINTNGEVVPYVPYEEGSGKRFRGENLSPRTKKWDNQRRTDFVFFKNQLLDKQRRKDEQNETAKKRQRDESAEAERRIKARFDSLRRVTWNETDHTLTRDQINRILDQPPAEAGEQKEEQMCIG